MLFTAGTWGKKSAGRFWGFLVVSSYREWRCFKKATIITPKEVVTHALLVNRRFWNMSLHIVEFFIASRVVMWDWYGLRNRELRGVLQYLDWNGQGYGIGRLLRLLLAQLWRRRHANPSRCRDIVREYEVVKVHRIWMLGLLRICRRLVRRFPQRCNPIRYTARSIVRSIQLR
jgi:hypothetical protein